MHLLQLRVLLIMLELLVTIRLVHLLRVDRELHHHILALTVE